MMTVHEIISDLSRKGARIEVQQEELKINIAKELMTAEVYAFIRKNKPDFIAYIKERNLPLQPAPVKEHYATTSTQRRLYFLHAFDNSSLAYNLPQLVKLEGNLDRAQLANAFQKLVQFHESLRTSFALVEEQLVQKIAKHVDFELEILTVEDTIEDTVRRFVRPFDLQEAPLMRAGLVELTPEEHLLIVDMHHIITDGISQSVLMKDFMRLYTGESLPEMPLQYKDYAEWESKQLLQRNGARDFWIKAFSEDLPVLDLPTDFKRPAVKSYDGNSIDFKINKEQTKALKAIAREERTTMFNLVLSVFNILISRLTNSEDVIIGTTSSGRQHADLENLIGMFVNTIPLRNAVSGAVSFRSFLREVNLQTLVCLDNQAYSYDELLNEIPIERDTSRNPLFDIMFVYLNFEEPELRLPGLVLRPYEKNQQSSQFDLSLIAYEADGQLHLTFEYASALFKLASMERFIGYFQNIVAAVAEDADRKICDIELLPPSEKAQLLQLNHYTENTYPKEETIVSLFQKQVTQTPQNIAIYCDGESLTYKELDLLSDRVAAYLQEVQGVTAGNLVGLMLERGKYLLPCILGILKTGAAYVPIDSQ